MGVALVTLFDDAREVDLDGTAALAAELVAAGMRSIVLAGSTGEAATLDGAERVALTKVVREAIPAGVPIIVGTGAPSARQAARLTAEVVAGGADAVLALSPPGAADPTGYYAEVVARRRRRPGARLPLPDDVGARHRRRRCCRASATSASSGSRTRPATRRGSCARSTTFAGDLYVGSPWLLSAAGPLGAAGAILAVANVEPALSVRRSPATPPPSAPSPRLPPRPPGRRTSNGCSVAAR